MKKERQQKLSFIFVHFDVTLPKIRDCHGDSARQVMLAGLKNLQVIYIEGLTNCIAGQ